MNQPPNPNLQRLNTLSQADMPQGHFQAPTQHGNQNLGVPNPENPTVQTQNSFQSFAASFFNRQPQTQLVNNTVPTSLSTQWNNQINAGQSSFNQNQRVNGVNTSSWTNETVVSQPTIQSTRMTPVRLIVPPCMEEEHRLGLEREAEEAIRAREYFENKHSDEPQTLGLVRRRPIYLPNPNYQQNENRLQNFFQIGSQNAIQEDKDVEKTRVAEKEAEDQEKSEHELWEIGCTIGDSEEPNTLQSRPSLGSNDLQFDDTDEEAVTLEPIPMRRSPSSLGAPISPSMVITNDTDSRIMTQPENLILPSSPLMLRRQNAIIPVRNRSHDSNVESISLYQAFENDSDSLNLNIHNSSLISGRNQSQRNMQERFGSSAHSSNDEVAPGGTQPNMNVNSNTEEEDENPQTPSRNSPVGNTLRDIFDQIPMLNLFRELDSDGIQNTFSVPRPEIENAPLRRQVRGYDINNLRESNDSNHTSTSSSADEFEDVLTKLQAGSTLQEQRKKQIDKLKASANFDLGSTKWKAEIDENLSAPMVAKANKIAEDLGVIGLLIYTRLFKFMQMSHSKILAEKQLGQEQMDMNNKNTRGGLPVTTDNFLVFISD